MLELVHMSKCFGQVQALDDLSLQVHPGEIMGMIGQNGAGKSTTFRLMLNFLRPDTGYAVFDGQAIKGKMYNRVGYLPEERGLYQKITVEEQILYFAELRGCKRSSIAPQIGQWMDKFEVKGKKTSKIKELSKGNQQKVQLITTLIHQPDLIILDEPFSGLDPVNAGLFKEAIFEAKDRGATIIFSSHNMDNVAQLCDSLTMLKDGRQVLQGNLEKVRQSFGRTRLKVEAPVTLEDLLEKEGVLSGRAIGASRFELVLANEEAGRGLFDALTAHGYIYEFSQQPPTLEEIFKEMVVEAHA